MSLSLQENLCGRNQSIPYNVYQVKHNLKANYSLECSLNLSKLPFEHNSRSLLSFLHRISQVDVNTAVLASSVVFLGLILSLSVFLVIIWFQELYEPRFLFTILFEYGERKTPPRISKERCRVPIDKAIAHRPSFTKNIVDTNIPVVFHEPLSQVHPPGQRSPCKLSELAHLWTPFHRQCDVLEATIITDGSFRQREYQTWSRFDADPLLEHQVLSGPDHGVLLALPQPHH